MIAWMQGNSTKYMEKSATQNNRLIDLHAHIVPGVDDGAKSFEESLQMLQMANSDGIETIVATPHVFSYLNTIKDIADIIKKRQEFLERLNRHPVKPQVLPGAEVFFTTNVMEYLHEYGELLCLNGSCYFLLEFPFEFVFPGIRDFIFSVLTEGWIPVIVHPERNRVIQRNPGMLYQWVKTGALIQVNAGSLKGLFGEEARLTSFHLLHHNLVHVIASDAHSLKRRPPELSFVHSTLENEGIEIADLLVYGNPRAILDNKAIIDIGEPLDPGKKSKIFDFLKGMFK
jgi:protein-tyrosine phosphatase